MMIQIYSIVSYVKVYFSYFDIETARAAVNSTFGYPRQQQKPPISATSSVSSVVSEARSIVQSMATSNRSGPSSSGKVGKYGLPFQSRHRPYSTSKKGKTPMPKIHQKRVVVLDGYEGKHTPEVYPLNDLTILVDGNIRYNGNDSEIVIRRKISDLMLERDHLKNILKDDFAFVCVCNKRVRKPDGNVPFDALGVNTVYPTGAIYVRLHGCIGTELQVEYILGHKLHVMLI